MHELLGATVTDKITGFSGIVTGICLYLTGCNQALVTPRMKDGKVEDAKWIDVQRLDIEAGDKVVLDNGTTPGCDLPAPIR